ncbi:DUF1776-domain-containing protein [Metschnikowia bicuspidata var. bicuspidata NRRL YB-4993]|uniref:DUF1776-domain-containing protein n=1 Tax=Metschnikowia bicuspidata var. bicuspidata NRRL YB-4993 TaxID=869754 RepID=A0A1A0HAP7_9ASCO|nr:DUF1776-domain-containing protein [Metschnikowia bicuspidata var. bicuspidata NRRL YB-4993]OBA21086.1 DUF1776-domain-containing protein [Metschnikowia bicuspidata var. bicuspidata NRRL YB-4993]
MVAEPVLATLATLRATYDSASRYLHAQAENWPDPAALWDSLPLIPLGGASAPPVAAPPASIVARLGRCARPHKHALLGAVFTGLGLAGLVAQRRKQLLAAGSRRPRRRRVPKLPNGARRDVVLVVGSPTEPMTRLVALDFEKRGFIVYVTLMDDKDRRYVQQNPVTDDVRHVDLCGDAAAAVARFRAVFGAEVVPLQGAEPHLLRLAAVVFAPSLYFPLGPLENTPSASWEKVLARLAVYPRLLGLGLVDLVRGQQAKLIAVVPTIVSSLRLSYHGAEAMFQNALKDLFATLAKELRPQGIAVTQVRLGNLHLSSTRALPAAKAAQSPTVVDAEVRSWSPEMQALYGAPFLKTQAGSTAMGPSIGSDGLRGLHHLLFDLVFATRPGPSVVYYGSGARTYERVTSFLPTALMEVFS